MSEHRLHKHLDLIAVTISRMAQNSFLIRGWCVTVVTGILALAVQAQDSILVLTAALPITAFWLLDAYYLMTERRFRALYDKVRLTSDLDVDYSMDVAPILGQFGFWKAAFSFSLLAIYGVMVGLISIIFLVMEGLI
ncbi:hypothetical protein [Heliomarina baculiformis]|uniref:hypothetical protein n=1 Tax=Heliomarina baculiformis TaxID=2872036 RepID=UPI001EE16602|nr:hypothetical protein [Heliomarina baculiformis]